MTPAELHRIFESLQRIESRQTEMHGRLETLAALRIVDSQAIEGVWEKINTMCVSGCALGGEHEKRIGKLENAPAKVVSMTGIIAGIVATVVSGVMVLITLMVYGVHGK